MSTGLSQNVLPLPAASPMPQARSGDMKSPTAYRTISEVATDLSLPQHVLRFWESKFQQIKPLKRGGGRRYYRPEDIQLIHNIKDLLYNQGFTIRGVQKLLRDGIRMPSTARAMVAEPQVPSSMVTAPQAQASVKKAQAVAHGLPAEKRREIETILGELKALREILKASGI